MIKNCKGNVLVYILLAVALLAALAFAISDEGSGQKQNQLTSAQAELIASEIITHAAGLKFAADQMNMFGIAYDSLLSHRPNLTAYNFNTERQIYHPSGGGMTVFPFDIDKYSCGAECGNQNRGWKLSVKQTDWTGSSDNFFISYIDVPTPICTELNKKLHNEETIYVFSGNLGTEFDAGTAGFAANALLETSECADCVTKKMACVNNTTTNVFYMLAETF